MKIKKHLAIGWTDLSWEVRIRNRVTGGARLDRQAFRFVRGAFEPLALPAEFYRSSPIKPSRPRPYGFTLIELLVVIAIIAILAGILLPVLAGVKTRGKVAAARLEMRGMVASINAYENDYHRNPASSLTEQASANTDFTFGTHNLTLPGSAPPVLNGLPGGFETNNSEIVLIILDIDQGVNANHARNPRKNKYWNAKMVSGAVGGVSTEDYVARDPFGNPYNITLDMNDDNKCLDAFYKLQSVSSKAGDVGHNGLSRQNGATGDKFMLNGPVMIWSAGPDKNYDAGVAANQGANKDNILTWAN